MYHGSCLCGAVQYELHGPVTDIIHCHCSLCRKASGTAYATNGFINVADFVLQDPGSNLKAYSSGSGTQKYFCGHCGAPIYSANAARPERYRLRLGSLNCDIDERPISHNFVTSKANWDDLDAALPRYERYEPSRDKN